MNKEDNSSSPPNLKAEPSASQEPGRNGPIVQGAMVRDSTLKWCVPAEGSTDSAAVHIAEEMAASVPASNGPETPRPDLNQADFQGALPEPIHEPLVEDPEHRPDSLEIMISEGTVQIETDPAALRVSARASDGSESEVTPPPRRSTTPMTIDPAWSTVTPPPKLTSGAVTPPPRPATPVAESASAAAVLTPPPKLAGGAVTPPPAAAVLTPPPKLAGGAVTPPPAATVLTPPPKLAGGAVTPPPAAMVLTPLPNLAGGAVTPPPAAAVLTPPPRLTSGPATPAPEVAVLTPSPELTSGPATPVPEVAVLTPSPELTSGPATPASEVAVLNTGLVTPPPRGTIPVAVEPEAPILTPLPELTSGPATPPPRRITPVAVEPAAAVLTPPPKPKTPPVDKAPEEGMVTPPPRPIVSPVAAPAKEPASGLAKVGTEAATPSPVTVQAVPLVPVAEPSEQPSVDSVMPIEIQPTMDSVLPPDEDEVVAESAISENVFPASEMGATPEAPIRMAETAEVGEGDFEVMEPLEASHEDEAPASSAPPPVPARQPGAAPSSGMAKAGEEKAETLPEALSRRPLKKNLKPWYEEVFDEDYLRTLPFMTAQQTLRETAFLKEALSPPAEGEILDVACGYGRHAIEFGQRGFRVTGLDLSLPLLIRAADEAQRRGLSINFAHADMREMAFENQFDAAYCVLTSFGYFDEETNLRVASSICRALKPGGRFLVDIVNRDYIVSDLPSRVWWEGDGCVVLEEVDFDFHTSRVMIRRSIVFGDGRQVEHEISIRSYSLHELARVLRRAGFQVLEVSGSLANKRPFLGAASRQIVLVCERPLT